jgi:hypothetical protein
MLLLLKRHIMRAKTQTTDGNTQLPRLQAFPLNRPSKGVPDKHRTKLLEVLKDPNSHGWAVQTVLLGVDRERAVPAIAVVHPSAQDVWQAVSSCSREQFSYLIERGSISKAAASVEELRHHNHIHDDTTKLSHECSYSHQSPAGFYDHASIYLVQYNDRANEQALGYSFNLTTVHDLRYK